MAIENTGVLEVELVRDHIKVGREYRVTWVVETDNQTDFAHEVITAVEGKSFSAGVELPGGVGYKIPKILSEFAFDSTSTACYCYERSCKLASGKTSGKLWHLIARYRRADGFSPDPDQLLTNPVLEPVSVSGSAVNYLEPTQNPAVKNSAGEPFENVEVNRANPVLTIGKSYKSTDFNIVKVLGCSNKTNSTQFFGFGKARWLARPPRWEQRFTGGFGYWFNVQYEFELNTSKHGWRPMILDRGWNERVDEGLRACKDKDNLPLNSIANLDGKGRQLEPGNDLVELGPFDIYEGFDFSSLGIPTSLALFQNAYPQF